MRTDRYRFTQWARQGAAEDVVAVELYDHQSDPDENLNIAEEPANAALVEELSAKLRAGWTKALPPASSR